MTQEVFKVEGYEYEFRFAKMNAIDILAFQTQYKFDNFEMSQNSIKNVLEHIEVHAGESWIPVKTKNQEVYTPDSILEDVQLLLKLINSFSEKIIRPVFQKSEESQLKTL